jgi:hypothetical protein
VERIYRVIFLILFIMGFVGAAASAQHDDSNPDDVSPMASLIRDVRLAQEVNDLNDGHWNDDVARINDQGLSRVEDLFQTQKVATASRK